MNHVHHRIYLVSFHLEEINPTTISFPLDPLLGVIKVISDNGVIEAKKWRALKWSITCISN